MVIIHDKCSEVVKRSSVYAKTEVNELDVAYWPEGNALCLFYGPTPISKNGKILAYSPVNIIIITVRIRTVLLTMSESAIEEEKEE